DVALPEEEFRQVGDPAVPPTRPVQHPLKPSPDQFQRSIEAKASTPATTSSTRTSAPRYADVARLWSTGTPAAMAGKARTGSASLVPTCSEVDAASAAVARPASTPARRSIPTETAVAVAAPPGTILPTV